jgi:transcriptional regulator with XRE-family HTH domain
MARAAVGLGVRELAALTRVSPDTIARFERGDILKDRTVEAIRTALEAAGAEFIAENGGGPGVRLRTGARGDPGASLLVEDLNSENDE